MNSGGVTLTRIIKDASTCYQSSGREQTIFRAGLVFTVEWWGQRSQTGCQEGGREAGREKGRKGKEKEREGRKKKERKRKGKRK